MQRWLFILLAVVLGWLPTDAHAHARTSQAYDTEPPLGKVVVVAGITMDTYQGQQDEPLSLHKYLYCQADPINGADPSGHDDIGDVMATMNIMSIGFSMGSPAIGSGRGTATAIALGTVSAGLKMGLKRRFQNAGGSECATRRLIIVFQ